MRVTLDAMPGRSFAGKVRRVAPFVTAVEKQARTVDVEVDLDPGDGAGHLLVGYSADIEVVLAVHDKVLRVPTSALLEGGRLLVVDRDRRLAERRVPPGWRTGSTPRSSTGWRPANRS